VAARDELMQKTLDQKSIKAQIRGIAGLALDAFTK